MARLRRGIRQISRGQAIVTDRLHVHICALLIGRPHAVLDNSYGKVRRFMAAFSGGTELSYRATSLDDGVALRDLLFRAHGAGLEVATHAIGDAAVAEALAAYADTGARGSIEHAQMARREDVRRMAELGIRASVQPAHLLDDRDLTDRIWGERSGRCFAFRWMLDDGVELAFGSDAPVSPLDPWLAMAAAVHRSADEREAWHPEQALTAAESLAASTDGAATIRPGSRGDLVLLDADPLAPQENSRAAAAHLRGVPVAVTIVAGRLTFDGR